MHFEQARVSVGRHFEQESRASPWLIVFCEILLEIKQIKPIEKVPEGSRRLEKAREGSRRFEKVREGSRRLNKIREGSRRFEKVPKGNL